MDRPEPGRAKDKRRVTGGQVLSVSGSQDDPGVGYVSVVGPSRPDPTEWRGVPPVPVAPVPSVNQ